MSELKGQILGVVLVIILFGTISAVLTAAFDGYKEKIEDNFQEVTGEPITYPSSGSYLTY